MTVYRQTCGNNTVGANVSLANSAAGGTAYDQLNFGGSLTPNGTTAYTYQNAIGAFGGTYSKIISSGSDYARWPIPTGGGGGRLRVPIYLDSIPTATLVHTAFYSAAQTLVGRFAITTAGKVQSYRGSTSTGASGLSTAVLSVTTLYWIEFWLICETGAGSNGTVGYQIYQADGTTTLSGGASSVGSLATGTTEPAALRLLASATSTGVLNGYYKDIAGSNTPLTVIGPPSNALPTGTITGNQNLAAASTATITVSASDSDGTIATYTWAGTRYTSGANPAAITIGTGSGTATITYTTGAAGSLDIWTCIVADNSGGLITPTLSTEVRVLTTGAAKPLRMNGDGDAGFTIIGGSTYEGTALNDASNTTRVESPDIVSTPASKFWRLEPMSTRTGLRVTLSDIVLTAGITNTNKARVRFGGSSGTIVTTRATTTLKKVSDDSTADVTTSDQTLYFDLTSGECSAITDWGYVEVGTLTGTV